MGRRRKKYKRIVRRVKKIPDVFQCPHCSNRTLVIKFEKSNVPGYKIAKISCGSCGLYYEMQVPELYEAVDVYAEFLDGYEDGSIVPEFRKSVEAGEVSVEST